MSWTLRNECRFDLDGVDWDSQPTSSWDINLTYNYTPMLNKAFALAGLGGENEVVLNSGRTQCFDEHFHRLAGMNNIEAGPIILKVYVAMINYKEDIEELQPEEEHGEVWGSYEQLLDTVKDMLVRNTNCLHEQFVWC